MKKHLITFGIFTILLISFSACYAQDVPKFEKTLSLKRLKKNVIVRRDERSIPYIEAKNEDDLYFAQGFETARDRLWQMDVFRRVARGEMAEIFGKAILKEDKRWRKFGFSEIAEETLKQTNPKLRKALENYSLGVNAYIATLDKKTLPIEFQILQYEPKPWKPTDTIVLGKILADALSTTWWQDLNRAALQALPKGKFEQLTNVKTPDDVILFGTDSRQAKNAKGKKFSRKFAENLKDFLEIAENEKALRKETLSRIGFYAEGLAASNNWVISGKRTKDGNAILANDPHLRATAPGIWYLTHLSTPKMQVAGVTFPGVPGVVLGHNQHIAWGATNVGPDVQDLYLEEFNEKGEYKTLDGWKKPRIRKEEIKVRKNPTNPETETEILEIVETRNGVIYTNRGKKQFALKWTARNPKNQEFEAFFLLNRAKNWKDFKSALKSYGGSMQNFVYADVKGNIGWYAAGKVPIRRKGEGELPYDGWTNDGEWLGYVPFEELPHLYNPPSGFIVTANQRIVGTDYKHQQITRQFASPFRAKRIYDLIKANPKISMDDVAKIQYDVYNIPLHRFAKEIIKRKAASDETLNILRSWDGQMKADSIGATVANAINSCVGNEIAKVNRPAGSWRIRRQIMPWAIPNNDKLWLPKSYSSYDELLKTCDSKATNRLSKIKRLGKDKKNWKWGTYNQTNFQHPLAIVPFIGSQFKATFTDAGGSGQVPNVGDAVSMRFVTKPANWDETRHVIPLGQSGNPKSKYWKDQYESWRDGKSPIFPFSKKAVNAATKKAILLTP